MGKANNGRAMDRKERWAIIYQNWEGSGLSQREFCIKESLALATFQKWELKLREQGVLSSDTVRGHHKKGKELRDFVPIEVRESNYSAAPYCILRFQNQSQVIIEKQENIAQLRELFMGIV